MMTSPLFRSMTRGFEPPRSNPLDDDDDSPLLYDDFHMDVEGELFGNEQEELVDDEMATNEESIGRQFQLPAGNQADLHMLNRVIGAREAEPAPRAPPPRKVKQNPAEELVEIAKKMKLDAQKSDKSFRLNSAPKKDFTVIRAGGCRIGRTSDGTPLYFPFRVKHDVTATVPQGESLLSINVHTMIKAIEKSVVGSYRSTRDQFEQRAEK
jgi:hypothetical protein